MSKKPPTASIGLSTSAEDYRTGRGRYKKGPKRAPDARVFGQDLMRGEHELGKPSGEKRLLLPPTSDTDFYAKKRAREKELGRKLTTEDFLANHYEADGAGNTGTSIFDPVLCELAYSWFCPPGGTVLDPFAGGSVRGIVAAHLGFSYHGVDLSERQVKANRAQARAIVKGKKEPKWIVGDSQDLPEHFKGRADFVFSCPPYGDLEVYSEDPRDLSTKTHPEFLTAYREIIRHAVAALRPNRFACFVVGDFRDEAGFYRNFPAETIRAFQEAGAVLYNEAILVTSVGSLPIRVGKQFGLNRKLGKTHQNVLVFFKGDPKAIRAEFPEVALTFPAAESDPFPSPA